MNKHAFYYVTLVAIVFSQQYVKAQDAAPEEGNIKFIKISKQGDNVDGPKIMRTGKRIEWYAAPFISISPDGKQIAFNGYVNNSNNLYIKRTDGGQAVIQRTFRTNVLDMSFSSDGKAIAFSDASGGNNDIFVINANQGSAIKQITSSSSAEVGPCFSPDSKYIYYCRSENNYVNGVLRQTIYYIWSYEIATGINTQYGIGFTPHVSPDGKILAITRNNVATGFGEIWTIDLLTGTETLIVSDSKRGFSSPQISPDGKRIVFVGFTPKAGNKPTNLDICVVNIDGSDFTQLTFHGADDVSPRWAHDGKSIYFLSKRGEKTSGYHIWNMIYESNANIFGK